jgi:hypothetical protein
VVKTIVATPHSSGVMVSESRFRTGYDFLTLVGKQNDEIVLLPFLGGFVEPAQGVEVIREFQNGIDVKPLGLEFLRHGDADNFSSVDLIHRECRFVGTENLGNFRAEEVF